MVSDNGKTFKSAARMLADSVVNEVKSHLLPLHVKWVFNIELAPWWGGMFERMVKATKRCLRKVIAKASLSFEELLTVVTEVEMIVNCRPLSFMSQNDLEEPLTPSHLITGRRLMSLPEKLTSSDEELEDPSFEIAQSTLTKRMKSLNCVINHFWKRWKFEYLLELRNHHKNKIRAKGHQLIAKGDVVIIHDDKEHRRFWRLGLVVDTIPGRDGLVRGAVVKVCPKGKKCKLMRRSVKQLYPLEVGNGQLNEGRGITPDRAHPGVTIQEVGVDKGEIEMEDSCTDPTDYHSATDKTSGPSSVEFLIETPEKLSNQLTEREAPGGVDGECLPSLPSNSDNETSHDRVNIEPVDRVNRRPSRRAAVLARDKIIAHTLS